MTVSDVKPRASEENARRTVSAADIGVLATAAGTLAIAMAARESERHEGTPPPAGADAPPAVVQHSSPLVTHVQDAVPAAPDEAAVHDPSTSQLISVSASSPATISPIVSPLAEDGPETEDMPALGHSTTWTSPDTAAGAVASSPQHLDVAVLAILGPGVVQGNADSVAGHGLSDAPPAIVASEWETPILDIGATLQSAVATLGQTVTEVVSQTVAVADKLVETVTDSLQTVLAIPATLADVAITGLLGGDSNDGNAVDDGDWTASIDFGDAVTMSFDHMTVQLGFVGQSHVDGSDLHDGAFSTLVGHHF